MWMVVLRDRGPSGDQPDRSQRPCRGAVRSVLRNLDVRCMIRHLAFEACYTTPSDGVLRSNARCSVAPPTRRMGHVLMAKL